MKVGGRRGGKKERKGKRGSQRQDDVDVELMLMGGEMGDSEVDM